MADKMIGSRYGRLVVIKSIGRKRGAILYNCKCDCGNEKDITGCDLRSGRVNSCGCLKTELLIHKNTTHNLKHDRLYTIYYDMKNRCYNHNMTNYDDYGGRGIEICTEWNNLETGFITFYEWAISNGYEKSLTIDRIDTNGNYKPSNCRWATYEVQSLNKRNTKYFTLNNETKTLIEWCKIFDISYKSVLSRLHDNWNIKKALTQPIRQIHRRNINE